MQCRNNKSKLPERSLGSSRQFLLLVIPKEFGRRDFVGDFAENAGAGLLTHLVAGVDRRARQRIAFCQVSLARNRCGAVGTSAAKAVLVWLIDRFQKTHFFLFCLKKFSCAGVLFCAWQTIFF